MNRQKFLGEVNSTEKKHRIRLDLAAVCFDIIKRSEEIIHFFIIKLYIFFHKSCHSSPLIKLVLSVA